MDAPVTKICPCCGIEKPISEYGKLRDGIQPRCKTCRNSQRKQRYEANRTKELEWRASYVAKNAERCAEYAKQWRANNPQRRQERSRTYYQENKDLCRSSNRQNSRSARERLADSYLRKVIAGHKGYDGSPITQAQIDEVRARILRKRAERSDPALRVANNTASHVKARKELADSYLRSLIRASRDYDGGKITQAMLDTVRARILEKRQRRASR